MKNDLNDTVNYIGTQIIAKLLLNHHFQIPRNNTCHDNFNGILTILITKVWIL